LRGRALQFFSPTRGGRKKRAPPRMVVSESSSSRPREEGWKEGDSLVQWGGKRKKGEKTRVIWAITVLSSDGKLTEKEKDTAPFPQNTFTPAGEKKKKGRDQL